jgi:hypothetical protein
MPNCRTGLIPVAVAAVVSACGEDTPPDITEPPNTFVTAKVDEIKVSTRRSKLFGEISKSYQLNFTGSSAERWVGIVGAHRAAEDDLRQIIGTTVSFSCWRKPAYGRMCHVLRGLTSGGRELLKAAQ